jgi:GUN4-like/Caspase domain
MARKALLIGTKTYQTGFKPLNSAPYDVEALADLLRHPEIGGFNPANVQVLVDRASGDLATQIETWYLQQSQDDFALLFIAGHGVKDGDRRLHFAATNTTKEGDRLITTTAVAASSLSNWLRGSKAQRQVVILNCCFSGAFGDLVPMDEGTIDVEEVLGAEGRVVMTSTSSMDYAFERQNGELSVYGHYLVEGLRTGAAATQGSDEITVDELHQYVSRKVQEEAPAMVPKLFAKGEGYRLRIAKVAIGDPEVKYRKKVEEIVREDCDSIDEVFSRPILEQLRVQLKLGRQLAAKIESDVLEPIQRRNIKRQQYQDFFSRAFQYRHPFNEKDQRRIVEYRRMLGLAIDDYEELEALILAENERQIPGADESISVIGLKIKDVNPLVDLIPLKSEKSTDYRKLRDLLKASNWEAADRETFQVMLRVVNRERVGWFDSDSLRRFPCQDLQTIDQLWTTASNGHFGFSIQRKIWEKCGSMISSSPEVWEDFADRIGWRVSGQWRNYDDLRKTPSLSLVGELPAWRGHLVCSWWGGSLFSRITTCEI